MWVDCRGQTYDFLLPTLSREEPKITANSQPNASLLYVKVHPHLQYGLYNFEW